MVVVDWLKTIVSKLLGWKGTELSTCGYHLKAAAIDMERLLRLLIPQNIDLHTRLWRIFGSKEEGKGKLPPIGEDDRSLEDIKRRSCLIYYTFSSILMHVYRGKSKKCASGDISDGKLTESSKESRRP